MNTLSHKKSTSPAADVLATLSSSSSFQPKSRAQAKESDEPLAKIGSTIFFTLAGFFVYAGWKIREREYFTAESTLR